MPFEVYLAEVKHMWDAISEQYAYRHWDQTNPAGWCVYQWKKDNPGRRANV
jgi:hypothetical protein